MVIRIIIYLFFVFGVGFLAFYIGEHSLMAMVFSMLLIPVFSIIMLFISFLRLRYEETVDKFQAVRGETITYTLIIRNHDFFIYPSVNVCFKENSGIDLGWKQEVYVLPCNQYSIMKDITCNHIGQYDIGVRKIELWDFFRFAKMQVKMKADSITVEVMPRIIILKNFKPIVSGEYDGANRGHRSQTEDKTEILDIRKYEHHIPLKYIHWKISAKRNELMVKKYDMLEEKMAYLFVDIGTYGELEDHERIKDIIIETVIAISKYCFDNNIPVSICFNNESLTVMKITDSYSFHRMYHSLSYMSLDKAVDIENVIKIYKNKGLGMSSMIVITSNISDDLQNLLISAGNMNSKAAFVYPVPDIHHKNADIFHLMDDLNENSVYTYYIEQADDIKKVLET